MAHQGLLRKSAQALAPAKVADMNDPSLFAAAQAKFPSPTVATSPVFNIPLRRFPAFDGLQVAAALNRQGNGASGGLFGYTKELLKAAVHCDQSILSDLGVVLAAILSEDFSQLALDVFRAASFVALEKDVAPGAAPDIRPIGADCALQKLLGALCFAADAPAVAPWQLGIGRPHACAHILSQTRAAVAGGLAVLTLDGRNAFNSVSRRAIEARLQSSPVPHLRQYFRLKYYAPTAMVARTTTGPRIIWCSSGTVQGSLPSGWFFADALHDVLDDVACTLRLAYLDDITLADTPDGLLDILPVLIQRLEAIGIALNLDKCELYSPVPLAPATLLRAEKFGLKIIPPDGAFKIVGGCVGHPVASAAIIGKKFEAIRTWFTRVQAPQLDARLAYTLLRSCGVPKFNHLCAMHDCDLMTPFYTAMQDLQAQAMEQITGIPAHSPSLIRASGAGLPHWPTHGPHLRTATLAALRGDRVQPSPTPVDSVDIQHPSSSAHRASALGNHASSWMMFGRGTLSGEEFATAMRLRCEYWPDSVGHCTCGFPFPVEDAMSCYAHLLHCPDNTFSALGRHDGVCSDIDALVRTAGFHTRREPTDFGGELDEKRPDLTVFTAKLSAVIDVTIVTNFCRSYCNLGAGAAAANARQKKDAKHAQNVESAGPYRFFPIVIESSGHCDSSIDDFSRFLASRLPFGAQKPFRAKMNHTIAAAVQRGNARIVQAAFARIAASHQFGHPLFS
jgi:hypothetical protein